MTPVAKVGSLAALVTNPSLKILAPGQAFSKRVLGVVVVLGGGSWLN